MKEKLKQRLSELHKTLEKEYKALSDLRNELLEVHKFELASDAYSIEDDIHSIQRTICRNLNKLNDKDWDAKLNKPLSDNVD